MVDENCSLSSSLSSGVNSCSYGGVICDDTQVINDKPAEAHAYMHSYMYTHIVICIYVHTHIHSHK